VGCGCASAQTHPPSDFYSSGINWGDPGLSPKDGGAFTIKLLESFMNMKLALAAVMTAAALLTATGCAVSRGQETMGAYVDDAGITTLVKARMAESKVVSATSISVETLNGVVMLSGFAKNTLEKTEAERIAHGVKNVKSVRNEIAIRP
jgi:osmotically-inducible protein OsmY